jgi:hypothetical protein
VVDKEMIDAVCEISGDTWAGSVFEVRRSAVSVAPDVLATYVVRYSGLYGRRIRTVDVTLARGELFITSLLNAEQTALIHCRIPCSSAPRGCPITLSKTQRGVVTHVVESHSSGDYPFQRER